jgi:hypothetical protein
MEIVQREATLRRDPREDVDPAIVQAEAAVRGPSSSNSSAA